MFGNRVTRVLSVAALAFGLAACSNEPPSYEFVNADMDDLRAVKDHLAEKFNYQKGYLYNVESGEVSFVSYDDYYSGSKRGEPRFFIKSLTTDPVLREHFEMNAEGLLKDMRSKANHVVDQDGQRMTEYLFYSVSNDGYGDLHKEEVSIEINGHFGSIKCYANGDQPNEVVVQEEDEENDIDRKVEYMLSGTCVPYHAPVENPTSNKAPAPDMNS